MSSGVSAPSTRTLSGARPTSSCASRSAACSNVSPSSTTPPGSDTCPPCRRLSARTVSRMCASIGMREHREQSGGVPDLRRDESPAATAAADAAPEAACAASPGSVPCRPASRREMTSRKFTNVHEPADERRCSVDRRGDRNCMACRLRASGLLHDRHAAAGALRRRIRRWSSSRARLPTR